MWIVGIAMKLNEFIAVLIGLFGKEKTRQICEEVFKKWEEADETHINGRN